MGAMVSSLLNYLELKPADYRTGLSHRTNKPSDRANDSRRVSDLLSRRLCGIRATVEALLLLHDPLALLPRIGPLRAVVHVEH